MFSKVCGRIYTFQESLTECLAFEGSGVNWEQRAVYIYIAGTEIVQDHGIKVRRRRR